MLALCGLERLGKAELATEILSRDVMLPAVGQGALALECRAAGEALRQFLDPLHDPRSVACVGAERAMLAALDGSCRTPIAGLAELDGDRLRVEGLLLKADCSSEVRGQREGSIADAEALGTDLGRALRDRAGPGFWLRYPGTVFGPRLPSPLSRECGPRPGMVARLTVFAKSWNT